MSSPRSDHRSPPGPPSGSTMHVLYVCALAVSAMGLYFGMRYDPHSEATPPGSAQRVTGPLAAGVVPATTYDQIRAGNLGPNAELATRLMPAEAAPLTDAPVIPGDLSQKLDDLEARAARRAFNGAPPTIPHRVDPRDSSSCIACHGKNGLTLGNVVARPMPHEHYSSCTQCHVPERELQPEEARWLDNSFSGMAAPTAGHRAFPLAPPVIPHTTLMRSNCASCHGTLGASGLQSSHPWRSSCTQCHAPAATLDQQPEAHSDAPSFLPAPNVISTLRGGSGE